MMRTLYVKIIVMTIGIMITSALLAFVVSNIYYQYYLKPKNDEKITAIAEDVANVFEKNDDNGVSDFLTSMSHLGYTIYLVNPSGEGQTYGEPFRLYNLQSSHIEQVLAGNTYHGIAHLP